jgi:hypothetical protein
MSDITSELTPVPPPKLFMFGQELPGFDWVNPDYDMIWRIRAEKRIWMNEEPGRIELAKEYYRNHVADFINDWGVTYDPRNAGTGRPLMLPFILFPKQIEFVNWLEDRLALRDDGILVKSRDCGASWMAMSFAITKCLMEDDYTFGFGSALKEKVDDAGNPDTLFYKGRKFLEFLPTEFTGGWNVKNKAHSQDMMLFFPETGSSINGDCGDNIGRGGRKTMYFVDEFAVVERPKLVDSNLIANTDCRIEMSTVQGLANVFAERARGGKVTRFDFHYRDDPRKSYRAIDSKGRVQIVLQPFFAEKKRKADTVVWAQEYECDFMASIEGVIIPQEWVLAAVGAAGKLGIDVSGERRAAYDVADRGADKNCFGEAYGIELKFIESWRGTNSTIYKSVERVVRECVARGIRNFDYDADGMGAAVRGDADKINDERELLGLPAIGAVMFRGSAAVKDPEVVCSGSDRKNKDFFENYKAQCWWSLRQRFRVTFEAVTALAEGTPIEYDPSEIVSIDPACPELNKTTDELSQPVWTWSKAGKMVIDKTPDGVASPNNGDTVMMLFPYRRPALQINDDVLEAFGRPPEDFE